MSNNARGLNKYFCFISERGFIEKLIVIDRENSRVIISIYPINHTLVDFQYVQNNLNLKFLRPQRNQSLELRLLNPLVADAVNVVTTNEKKEQEIN